MDSSRLYLIGGVTAATLAGAYVLWGPSLGSKHKKDWVRGLRNLGNTCFLNSVLQALAPCNSLTSWIAQNKSESSILTSALSNVFKGLNNETSSKVPPCPTEVLSALRLRRWQISNEEQDAHELFHVLTTTLQEESSNQHFPLSLLEVNKIEQPHGSASTSSPLGRGILSRVCGTTGQSFRSSFSSLLLPTKGLLACRLICSTCGFRNALRYDSFDSISLTLPELFWGSMKLEQCLKQWTSVELVPDLLCAGCCKLTAGKKQLSTFTKQLRFGRLPGCLCLHLVRTVWLPTGTPCKRSEHVAFPEYLNLGEYSCLPHAKHSVGNTRLHSGLLGGANQDAEKVLPTPFKACDINVNKNLQDTSMTTCLKKKAFFHLYQLKSVIVHIGGTFSGHFITYRRGPESENHKSVWFCVSDMCVRQVTFEEVLTASAYMLLYERL